MFTNTRKQVRQMLEGLYPAAAVRRSALYVFAECIEAAHEAAPGGWRVALVPGAPSLRLAVNGVPVCALVANGVWFALDAGDHPEQGLLSSADTWEWTPALDPADVPARSGIFHLADAPIDLWPAIQPHTLRLIATAAQADIAGSTDADAQTPAALAVLSEMLGRDLPAPGN